MKKVDIISEIAATARQLYDSLNDFTIAEEDRLDDTFFAKTLYLLQTASNLAEDMLENVEKALKEYQKEL